MPDLTRETLAELRRLRKATEFAFSQLRAVMQLRLRDQSRVDAAHERLEIAQNSELNAYIAAHESLLAAAERGLDVEGGR